MVLHLAPILKRNTLEKYIDILRVYKENIGMSQE